MRPVGETEFVNGIAAMSASGQLRDDAYRCRHRRYGRLDDRGCSRGRSRRAHRGWRRAISRIRLGAFWHREPRYCEPSHQSAGRFAFARRLSCRVQASCEAQSEFRGVVRAHADQGCDQSGAGVSRYDDRARSFRRACGDRTLCGKTRRSFRGVESRHRRTRAVCERGRQARRPQYGSQRFRLAFARRTRRSSEELAQATQAYFENTIERFGVKRCLFESNFPVDKLSCSYTVLWNSFKRLSKEYSRDERAALFHDTAARVYRI